VAYRLPGGRVPLVFEDGPYAGLQVEVEPITAWAVYRYAVGLVAGFFSATEPAAEFGALRATYEQFVTEAQPTWEIVDHRGPVPATTGGLLRLPLPLALRIVELWTETFVAVEADAPSTAVDEVYPPSPLRNQLNEVLARKAREAA
jgi:hypothetical protein